MRIRRSVPRALGLAGALAALGACASAPRRAPPVTAPARPTPAVTARPTPAATARPTQLAMRGAHGCVRMSDGTARCWGANTFGELGDGTHADRAAPVTVPGLDLVTAVAIGEHHACARRDDGTVRCWGSNASGELGDGTHTDRAAPVAVAGLAHVTQVALGRHHSCALLEDHTVACWGRNTDGQVAVDGERPRTAPVAVPGVTDAVQLVAGASYACVRRARGTVACWGLLPRGVFGLADRVPRGVREVPGLTGVKDLSGSSTDLCVVLGNDTPRCLASAGANPPSPGWRDTARVFAGTHDVCVVRGDGRPFCWQNGASPDAIRPDDRWFEHVREIYSGGSSGCLLADPGELWCWGDNARGEAASGAFDPVVQPTRVRFDGPPAPRGEPREVPRLAFGVANWCLLRHGRELECDTLDHDGLRTRASSPIAQVAVAHRHGCVLSAAHRVTCFGANDRGQLGFVAGSPGAAYDPGYDDQLASLDARAIAVGEDFSCALVASGGVHCWGRNDAGQLGDGTTTARGATPVRVGGVDTAQEIVAGDAHGCARLADGTVRCWGDRSARQLGGPGTGPAAVTVDAVRDAVELAAGALFTCARVRDGTVRCWGTNLEGELGNGAAGPATGASTPVRGLTDATRIVAAAEAACALRRGGTVVCWGRSPYAELGDAVSDDRATPGEVVGLSDVRELYGGGGDLCALLGNGTLRCWGAHFDGQIPEPVEL